MKKYYMSIDNLVAVTGETEQERFAQAKQAFLDLLNSDNPVEIVEIDEDDE